MRHVLRTALLSVVSLLVSAAPALAALTVTTPATATFGITLSGVDQTPTFSVAMTVTSTAPGTAGWNLTASASQFTSAGGKTFPTTAASVTGVADNVGCTGGGCTNPTNAVTWPITLGAAAIKIDNAAVGTGKGTNVETGTFRVAVPSNVFSGSYTSTLTVSVIAGP